MIWQPESDKLGLKINHQHIALPTKPTKADIVSAISKVYDPTGLFGPTLLIGKLIMQDFWRIPNTNWQKQAPLHLVQRWQDYHHEITALPQVTVPRWIEYSPDVRLEWHIFTDASELAYGAVVYLRVIEQDGTIKMNILTSKSRVAPLKAHTIPRLELFGALLGARLLKYVRTTCKLPDIPVFCWTDSSIVLHWIRKEPGQMVPFIATRISEITDITGQSAWNYIKGIENPADILSRGATASQLKSSNSWWHGPVWIVKKSSEWPSSVVPVLTEQQFLVDNKETKKPKRTEKNEMRNNAQSVLLISTNLELPPGDPTMDPLSVRTTDGRFESLVSRRSTYNGVLRVTAYVLRFIYRARYHVQLRDQLGDQKPKLILDASLAGIMPLTPKDLDHALVKWLRIMQKTSFCKEINNLMANTEIPRNSRLKRLTPFWDQRDRLLRITGRLDNADFSYDEKHQIILPSEHAFTKLMIVHAHDQTLHGNTPQCMAYLRRHFWIIALKVAIKQYINKECITCIRFSKVAAEQLMGQLPMERIMPAPPFARVGIDFAGPFILRRTAVTTMALRKAVTSTPSPPTTIKGWAVIFVCLVTRAIHLDVVRGLTVEHFLDAFARFTSRRGNCSEIWSDNGTNFVGSNNELQRVLKEWKDGIPFSRLADMGTTWKFITPAAPHRGGIWEAGVKSFKYHLRRVMGNRILTADQLYTLVVQIEGCLNSRPLFPASNDPSDLNPITPAHLAIGRSILERPLTEDVSCREDNRLTLWGLQQKLQQQFWSQWKDRYIIELQTRNKWYNIRKNIKPNDMVLIMDENTPPSVWPLGRVVEVSVGNDGLVRSAKILVASSRKDKIVNTTLDRPIQKLCILLSDDVQTPPPNNINT